MADKYIKLDTVLRLIESVKDNYKENRDECPINYGTMVGLEVELNTGELFTEQEIVKPYLEKLLLKLKDCAYEEPEGAICFCEKEPTLIVALEDIENEIDNLLSESEVEE